MSEEVYFFFYAHDLLLEELWGQRPTRFQGSIIQDLRNLDGVGGVDILLSPSLAFTHFTHSSEIHSPSAVAQP